MGPVTAFGIFHLTNRDPLWLLLTLIVILIGSPVAICLLVAMLINDRRVSMIVTGAILIACNLYIFASISSALYVGYTTSR